MCVCNKPVRIATHTVDDAWISFDFFFNKFNEPKGVSMYLGVKRETLTYKLFKAGQTFVLFALSPKTLKTPEDIEASSL